MLFTKAPFPSSKPDAPISNLRTPSSYPVPTTTPAPSNPVPPAYAIPSTPTAHPNTVDLEEIFEEVHQQLQAEAIRGVPCTPDSLTSSTSESESENEPVDTAVDLRLIGKDFLSHHMPNTLPARLQRDRELQERRLRQLDPEVLTAAIWGGYKTITAIINDDVDQDNEKTFRDACKQLLPFFSVFAERSRKQGFQQVIQIPATFEHVDHDADFVVLTGRDYLNRQQRIKAKEKAISLTNLHGYSQPDVIDRDDLLMAHNVNSSIRLTIGGGTSIPAPFPAHVLRDVPAVQRFTEVALPGTLFLDGIPTEVEVTRLLFGVCSGCAGLIPDDGCNCVIDKLRERHLLAPSYTNKTVGGVTHFVPQFLEEDFDLHAAHYKLVFPGACFLFSRTPPAIADARANFRLCADCGLAHKILLNSPPFTMLPTPAALSCPYNLRLMAEKFVRKFQQTEAASAKPAVPYSSGRLFIRD